MALERVAQIRVTYGDTDKMGFVYYANFLRYFEMARGEYIRGRGRPYRAIEEEDGIALPVVEARVRYRSPARYDDLLALCVAPVRVGGASLTFSYEIRRIGDDALLAEGETTHAVLGRDGRPCRFPPHVRALVLQGTGLQE